MGEALKRLTDEQLLAAYRVAKEPGLRPFFRNPRAMIALRDAVLARQQETDHG